VSYVTQALVLWEVEVPTHIKAMCQFSVGSTLPRDVMQITPCFRTGGVLGELTDWQSICDDLADGLAGIPGAATRQLSVRLYDLDTPGTKQNPNRPKATAIRNVGQVSEQLFPREVCLCLSFWGGQNLRTQRGRLYVPGFIAMPAGQAMTRPDSNARTAVAQLVPLFTGLGGVDCDWIVWSDKLNQATSVLSWYVDDEWDTQRRRGLKPTTRTSGTTSEG
jgi:hypothetical protein